MPNILVTNLHSLLAFQSSLIFQQSINTGRLPKLWKCSNIVPVYKDNCKKYCVENYKPISLTSIVCKVMESIKYDKFTVIEYQITYHQMCDIDIEKKITTSNLLELNNDVTRFLDDDNSFGLITIDFSKAFDKITHKNCYINCLILV